MYKETTYREKFILLKDWFPVIMEVVKKDLKQEHLKKDIGFGKKYFANKNINKLTTEELSEGYQNALNQEEATEDLSEFIANRWLLKHTDIYNYFEKKLEQINPNFNEMTEINDEQSKELTKGAIEEFGAPNTYLFAVINSVVFTPKTYEHLRTQAKQELVLQTTQQKSLVAEQTEKMTQQSYQQQIARLTDKYEKKLQGLQKKYIQDVDSLRKQIATLQRKLNGK